MISVPPGFWDQDWSTPELAIEHTARLLEVDPEYLRAEGPPGGPYTISYDGPCDDPSCEVGGGACGSG